MDAQPFLKSQMRLYLGDDLPQRAMGIFRHWHRTPFVDDYFFPGEKEGTNFEVDVIPLR